MREREGCGRSAATAHRPPGSGLVCRRSDASPSGPPLPRTPLRSKVRGRLVDGEARSPGLLRRTGLRMHIRSRAQ